ncbi:hypothetical protein DM01DRAFT_349212 [Hesseltinella vesiculosa]|uniref:DNA damage-binding protein 1 n=1 Tax=Hesseltinella vesiculosa TaxID=101127 RepID=A0A1X2GSU3_9FUNG|nr:hypothetical protein DM01DRAFT_349212 [Hesseltinella vesiculosa]
MKVCFAAARHSQHSLRIYLCCSNGRNHSFLVARLDLNNITLEQLERFDYPFLSAPSCFYPLDKDSRHYLLVGDYNQKLHLFSLADTNPCMQHVLSMDLEAVPHSLCVLDKNASWLLLSDRCGDLVTLSVADLLLGQWTVMQSYRRCALPFMLAAVGESTRPSVLACGEKLLLISQDDQGELTFDEVYTNNGQQHLDASPLPPSLVPDIMNGDNAFAFTTLVDDQLLILAATTKAQFITRELTVGYTPTKLLLESSICDRSLMILAADTHCRGKVAQQLQLMDQRTGDMLSTYNLDPGEAVCCMAPWQVQNGDKLYHYVCIGTKYQDARIGAANMYQQDENESGSLQLYRIKYRVQGQTPVALIRQAWNKNAFPGGVHAVCVHPQGLLFASGAMLYLYQLDADQGELEEITKTTLRYPITSIQVKDEMICVGTFVDSVHYYVYNQGLGELEFWSSDIQSRNVHHILAMDQRTVAAVTHDGDMFALKSAVGLNDHDSALCQPLNYQLNDLDPLFSFHYGEMLIKLRITPFHRCSYLLDPRSLWLTNHLLPWTMDDNVPTTGEQTPSASPGMTMTDPIVACTVSGGVLTIHRCSEAMFTLLKYLQDRLIWNGCARPVLGSSKRFWHWFVPSSGAKADHVLFGDLLAAFQRMTPEQKVKVLDPKPTHGSKPSPPLMDFFTSSNFCPLSEGHERTDSHTMTVRLMERLDRILDDLDHYS